MKFLIFSLIFFCTTLARSNEDIWAPFQYFVGDWQGHETGRAGIGEGERTYEFIMNGVYLYAKNVSRFKPQEKNPDGEVHEDVSFLSYDKGRKVFVLREFHIEGFVNQYTLDSLKSNETKFVFISESSENAPPGLRARVTLEIKNENEFVEIFELAFPDRQFSEWLKNYWTRIK